MTEPGELARRDERQRLVRRLEDLTAFVEHVAPGGLVAGDARVQHEVVVAAGDRDRVELDRPECAEDLEHRVRATLEGSRRRQELPCHEEAPRGVGRYLHGQDAIRWAIAVSTLARQTSSRVRTRAQDWSTHVSRIVERR